MPTIGKRQKQILEFARTNGGKFAKHELVNRLTYTWYYCNASANTGCVLSGMVKSGLLIRVKHGHYKLPEKPITNHKPAYVDNDQLTLNLFS